MASAGRVAVVHPPVSIARDFIDYPYFSDLGAVQLAAVLRDRGHTVDLINAFAMPGSTLAWRQDGRALLGATVADVIAAIPASVDAIVLAYTPFHRPPHRDDVLAELLTGVSGTPIILADCYQSGQHYVETSGDDVLAAYPEVRAYVKYEAEVAVPALLADIAAATGVHRGPSPVLDDLPFPAWDAVDLDARAAFNDRVVANLGRGGWAFPIDGRALPVVTSRGCPFDCAHCSSNPDRLPGEAKTQRRYSAERLAEYIDELTTTHGATRLAVLDELINVNEAHFDHFLELAKNADVRFEIPNGLRADYLEPRHFARMRGRVTTISVSAESGSQRVLDESVNKKLDLANITRAAENAHRAGVPLMIHWMIGLPGETAEEINETLERALKLWDEYGARPAVQFATPLPGTKLAEGRSLPVVDDWGPYFQKGVSAPLSAIEPAVLNRFMTTFHKRLQASTGPQKLIMNVTYVCNNHCAFCAVGTRTQIDGHPTRQRQHLDKYRRHGVHMVDFDGGEPTLNPELVPLIRYAKAIGYDRINVTTNGRMCAYPEFAKKLTHSGITTLLFSVHGADAKSHGREVGVPEAFEQTVAGIENCVAEQVPGLDIGMNITLTKHNHRDLARVGELALSLGLSWFNIQFLTPFGRATTRHAPDTQEAADVTMRFIDDYADRMKIQIINLPFCFVPGYERYLVGDLNKIGRHMVFVNNETVNLANYLAERRSHTELCAPCSHRCFCGGFFDMENSPEPEWLVTADSLVRNVEPELV
jgi:MoaA/NifB/PqqE/SkfB family radical SAM enzyme